MKLFANSIFMTTDTIRENWEIENKDYIKVIQKPFGAIPYFQYTLWLPTDDVTLTNPPSWLKRNWKHIDFDLSKKLIEEAHLINIDETLDEAINEAIALKKANKKSVDELIGLGCKFDSCSYDSYMGFTFDANYKITVSTESDYVETVLCYSNAFFKSILLNNNESDFKNCFFTFAEVKIGTKTTIALKVQFSNNVVVKYYDYSQNPPHPFLGLNTVSYIFPKLNPIY